MGDGASLTPSASVVFGVDPVPEAVCRNIPPFAVTFGLFVSGVVGFEGGRFACVDDEVDAVFCSFGLGLRLRDETALRRPFSFTPVAGVVTVFDELDAGITVSVGALLSFIAIGTRRRVC